MSETTSSTLVLTLPSPLEIMLTRGLDASFERVLEAIYQAGTHTAL